VTPDEFKTRYIASLPKVPEELRDELGLERFVVLEPNIAPSLELPPAVNAFLTNVGLPASASPFLNFDLDPKGRVAPVERFPSMIAIGSNAYGDDICFDSAANFAVVYLNHDNMMKRVLINSSLCLLAESLCLYLTHRHASDPPDLLGAIETIDPTAAKEGAFWYAESRSLKEDVG